MLVSVVIPAYNAERFITATVESVLSQTHAELELLLIDDGSHDRTASIVEAVGDDRVRVMRYPNGGTVTARNRGLRAARGPYIAFLDHDDTWYPQKLERQVDVLDRNRDAVAVGALMHYISDDGRRFGLSGEDPRPPSRQQMVREAALMPCAMSSILWRGEAIHGVGEFDPTVPQVDELEMLTRVLRSGRLEFIPEPLGQHRIHPRSVTAGNYREQRIVARFLHARLRARNAGNDLTREEFESLYRRDWRARRNDRVAYWYRKAGLNAAGGRLSAAAGYAALAFLGDPLYFVPRLRRQLLSSAGRASLRR